MTSNQNDHSSQDVSCPQHDNLRVRSVSKTPGEVMSQSGKRLVLHNHGDPCENAERIENPSVGRLGADIPFRPELKKLCGVCEWPDGAEAAFRRTVKQFRGTGERGGA